MLTTVKNHNAGCKFAITGTQFYSQLEVTNWKKGLHMFQVEAVALVYNIDPKWTTLLLDGDGCYI